MSGRSGVSVVISATDAASAKIDAINKRLAAMQAPVERVQKSLAKFADLSGINRLGRGIENIARAGTRAFQALGQLVGPLGAITGAASIAGIAALVNRWGEFGQRLANAANRANTTASRLYTLQGSARLAGASAEDLTQGLTTLSDTLTNAVGGRATQAYSYLKQLGVQFQNTNGSARNAADVLPDLADALNRIQNPTLRARIGTELLGGAYERLAPWLRRGKVGMAELNAIVKRYGVTTDAGTKGAIELQMAQSRLGLAVEGLSNSIAERLGPALSPLLTQMADWIAANRKWIADDISDDIKSFALWLKSINWTHVKEGVIGFYNGVHDVIEAVGGWKDALLILLAIRFAPMIASLVSIGVQVGRLIIAFGTTLVAAIFRSDAALALFSANSMKLPLFSLLSKLSALTLPLALSGDAADNQEALDAQRAQREGRGDEWRAAHPNLSDRFWDWFTSQHGSAGGTGAHPASRYGGGRSGPVGLTASTNLTTEQRSLLDALSGGESGGSYTAQNHGAYGRYQFTQATRNQLLQEMGLPLNTELTPELQDRMAIRLAMERGWRPGMTPEQASAALRGTWVSLPGGSQQNTSADTWTQRLRDAAQREGARPMTVGGGTGTVAPDVNLRGGASLHIKVAAPQGTQVGAATTGNIFQGAPRVEQSAVGYAGVG